MLESNFPLGLIKLSKSLKIKTKDQTGAWGAKQQNPSFEAGTIKDSKCKIPTVTGVKRGRSPKVRRHRNRGAEQDKPTVTGQQLLTKVCEAGRGDQILVEGMQQQNTETPTQQAINRKGRLKTKQKNTIII